MLLLPVLFSIFTSKVSLQNTNSTPIVKVGNANVAPRRSPRTYSNTSANTYSDYKPTPTPPANSTIRGRVFYADTGRAVKRSSIMLMLEDGSGPGSSPSALTDGDGNFQIKNVRAGIYYAMVNAPGVVSPLAYADFSKGSERDSLKDAFDNFEKIVVDGITDVDTQIAARRGGAIGGRVSYDDGDAAIGVKVEILRKINEAFVSVIPNFSVITAMMSGDNKFQTDDRGMYRFAGLPAGDYIVKVTENTTHGDIPSRSYYDPFESTFGSGSFLTVFFPDALETKQAQLINVQLGQEITEINLTLPSRNLYKIEGKIVNAKDKSPVKARIILKRDSDNNIKTIFNSPNRQQNTSLTDENGGWKFKEIPKGTYRIIVEPVENESEYRSFLGDFSNSNMSSPDRNAPSKPKLAKKSQEIIIEDKDLTEMVIEVGYGATLSGTARVENSEEMPKRVTLIAFDEKTDLSVTDDIGNYRETNEAKTSKMNHDFKIENITEGKINFNVFIEDSQFYVKSATLNGVDLLGNPFEIKEGENLRNAQIIIGNDVGTLKGVILNNEKQPLKELQFLIIPTDAAKRKNSSFYRNAVTNQNGEFEIKAAPGEYAVIFYNKSSLSDNREKVLNWIEEAIKDAETFKVEAGKTETITIKKKSYAK